MTVWTPDWALEINGAGDVTNLVIADLTVTSGRSDIYSQPIAGYCRFLSVLRFAWSPPVAWLVSLMVPHQHF